MVQEISYEELQKLWGKTGGKGVSFILDQSEIEEWKQNGKFKHLKNELMNIPNVKFICIQNDDGNCRYVFFTHSKEMSCRLIHLTRHLREGEYSRIAKLSNKDDIYGRENIEGTPKLCKLF